MRSFLARTVYRRQLVAVAVVQSVARICSVSSLASLRSSAPPYLTCLRFLGMGTLLLSVQARRRVRRLLVLLQLQRRVQDKRVLVLQKVARRCDHCLLTPPVCLLSPPVCLLTRRVW